MKNTDTLYCWSAGGPQGMDMHVGIWLGLHAVGIRPAAHCGSSAGAVIGAMAASGIPPDLARDTLLALSDRDFRAEVPFWRARMFSSGRLGTDHIIGHSKIERLLRENLPACFSDLPSGFSCFATDEATGEQMELTSGDLRRAVLASLSICGVFPPVLASLERRENGYDISFPILPITSDGRARTPDVPHTRRLVDGGYGEYLPLPRGWEQYRRIVLLIANPPLHFHGKGALGRLLWGKDLLIACQISDAIRRVWARRPDAIVLRPAIRSTVGGLRFDHDLINKAADYTVRELAARRPTR
jgi:predicted acylesterase/phospholipase RssA